MLVQPGGSRGGQAEVSAGDCEAHQFLWCQPGEFEQGGVLRLTDPPPAVLQARLIAVDHDKDQRAAEHVPGNEPESGLRLTVRPLCVVEDQHDLADRPEVIQETLPDVERIGFRIGRNPVRVVAGEGGQRGGQLAEHAPGQRLLILGAAYPDLSRWVGVAQEVADQRGLSNARAADQDDDAGHVVLCGLPGTAQFRQLRFAPDEGRRRKGRPAHITVPDVKKRNAKRLLRFQMAFDPLGEDEHRGGAILKDGMAAVPGEVQDKPWFRCPLTTSFPGQGILPQGSAIASGTPATPSIADVAMR